MDVSTTRFNYQTWSNQLSSKVCHALLFVLVMLTRFFHMAQVGVISSIRGIREGLSFDERGIPLNKIKSDNLKRTPLHLAAESGKIELVKKYLNGNLHARDCNGQTPLHRAVSHPKILKYLLDQGANLNEKDDSGFTALDYALLGNLHESVELLQQRKAEERKSNFKFKPFDINAAFKEILDEIYSDPSLK